MHVTHTLTVAVAHPLLPAGNGRQAGVEATATADSVDVGIAYYYDGTFTVYSGTHPLEYTSGLHHYSVFNRGVSDKPANETVGMPRLGDRYHYFDFVRTV